MPLQVEEGRIVVHTKPADCYNLTPSSVAYLGHAVGDLVFGYNWLSCNESEHIMLLRLLIAQWQSMLIEIFRQHESDGKEVHWKFHRGTSIIVRSKLPHELLREGIKSMQGLLERYRAARESRKDIINKTKRKKKRRNTKTKEVDENRYTYQWNPN